MVSRVSPPAQSIGLFRLQRGGSKSSKDFTNADGSVIRSSTPSWAMASEVTTPQPPTVVSTTTLLPRGSGCVAKLAATSKPSSTVLAREAPVLRHSPSKILSLLAKAPVWLCAAREPASVAPPFTTTSGLLFSAAVNEDSSALPSLTLSIYAKLTRVSLS